MSAPPALRAVLIDDEAPARERLRRLLREHPDVIVVGEAEEVSGAVELIDRERPDLCFLDVQIPGGDGFAVLRRVRHMPRVIFTTAHDQYAVRAFEVQSVDYLLKPFRPERFAAALSRVREERSRAGAGAGQAEAERSAPAAHPERIPARKGARLVLIEPAEIVWFEAEETLVFARTDEGRFLVDRTLAELEARLGAEFFRAHRRFLVRIDRIAEVRSQEGGALQLTIKDTAGTALPLSRRQARRLKERLAW